MSNILAIPLAQMTAVTGNNEDWIESIVYLVNDNSGTPDTLDQLDLRGINFTMEVRRHPEDHEVILIASTKNRWMGIGAFPNFGFLLLYVPIGEMQKKIAGNYVADIVANDGQYTRKIVEMSLTLIEGITR